MDTPPDFEGRFVFQLDWDIETGHGWRRIPSEYRRVMIDTLLGDDESMTQTQMSVYSPEDEEWSPPRTVYPECAYAWITPAAYYAKRHCFSDFFRHVAPDLKGACDMPSHFEFRMSPAKLRAYLQSLGMVEIPERR